jgi:hypothetical protein
MSAPINLPGEKNLLLYDARTPTIPLHRTKVPPSVVNQAYSIQVEPGTRGLKVVPLRGP